MMALMNGPPKDFEEYLDAVPELARTTLETLRRMIRDAVPELTEAISYRMPTFKYQGRPLVALAAAKDHCSLHLMGYVPRQLEADLTGFDTGKGTIRFPSDQPLPEALVRKILAVRMAQVESKAGRRRSRS
jgi:uncharacterized protein YdhG (YjbR/CyaY superfamily)